MSKQGKACILNMKPYLLSFVTLLLAVSSSILLSKIASLNTHLTIISVFLWNSYSWFCNACVNYLNVFIYRKKRNGEVILSRTYLSGEFTEEWTSMEATTTRCHCNQTISWDTDSFSHISQIFRTCKKIFQAVLILSNLLFACLVGGY